MSLLTLLMLFAAGILGGLVNAVAGGATFFTFPAMMATGLGSVTANASSTLAVWPGNALAAVALRRELFEVEHDLRRPVMIALVGGAIGALLLLYGGDSAFRVVVPFLLAIGTILFAYGPAIQVWLKKQGEAGGLHARIWPRTLLGAASLYGGYFGAGVGIMMLAALSLGEGFTDLRQANAMKNLLGALVNVMAIVIFLAYGAISWPETLAMFPGAVVGGFIGGRLAKTLPLGAIRIAIIAVGTALSIYYFWALLR